MAITADDKGVEYKVVATWKVGGDGGWDYLTADGDGHRLFIARGTRVMVVDTESGKQVGEIPDTAGVHGVALDYELGRGFTSNGREDTVSVFDLKTLAVEKKIKVGNSPDAILYDPFSKRVFTFNEIVAFDPRKLTVRSRWKLTDCEEPTGLAIDLKHRRLFAGCGGNKKMAIVNGR
jgi:YVTN family beta-propeller protein